MPSMSKPARLAVVNVVGLSRSLLGDASPRLNAFIEKNGGCEIYQPEFPAVTCTAQSAVTTGLPVDSHGIVANGWYDRESAEMRFWKQSNAIVHGEKLWDKLHTARPSFTCAKLFWWYNMHASVDFSMTPRPLYPADGRKVFDIHTQPMDLREKIKSALGDFPFPSFWGPAAGIASSQWIANAARWTEDAHSPDLNLVYLPHLDYALQKDGPNAPNIPHEVAAIDTVVGDLIDHLESRGVHVIVMSEYGISPVSKPVHLNRLFREKGWLSIKDELGRDTLDTGGSRAFVVADHQIAHIYINDPTITDAVRDLVATTPGVAEIRQPPGGIGGERAGDFIAVSDPDAWFTYYFWNDDARAPDYARTIDIHRKPGYDPCELFIDPTLRFPKLRIASFLLKKKLGLRGLLDVIPLDATLVKGSHGRDDVPDDEKPIIIGSATPVDKATDVHTAILAHFEVS